MTAELVRGQNHPLPGARLEIRVSAGRPVVAGATLSDAHGKVRGVEWVAHPGSPALPGLQVSRQAAADHRLAVDLDALPDAVHRVDVLLALPLGVAGPATFRGLAAPFVAVTGLDGTEIAGFTLTGLDAESAVIALELYRRQGAWKVRAVGQGYAGGLAEMLADQGLPEARELAAAIDDTVAQGLARSVPPPPPHLTEDPRTGPTAQAHQGTAHPAHQDPARQARRDPTHQDPRHQNLARQDPAHQDPAPQSPAHHGLQGPARQAQAHQGPAHQDPARQAQAPQDPAPQGPAHHGHQGPAHPDHAPQGPAQGPSAPSPRRPGGDSPAAPATSGDRA
ncbi:TerD family protein, partial [Streptomyces sp. NPDC005904]|uniref:TerD family protein n=1 Tax=Streptomyces sp. NPDC005904 TaxID=3154570 RepID=UPI0033D3DF66